MGLTTGIVGLCCGACDAVRGQVKGYAEYLLYDELPLDHYEHVVTCLRNPNLDLFLQCIKLTPQEHEQVEVLRRARAVPHILYVAQSPASGMCTCTLQRQGSWAWCALHVPRALVPSEALSSDDSSDDDHDETDSGEETKSSVAPGATTQATAVATGEATVVAQVEVAAADGSGSAAVSAGVAAPDASAVAATACPWYAYDTDNGLRYYYNATTEESAWQLPDGFVEVRSSQAHWLRPLLMR